MKKAIFVLSILAVGLSGCASKPAPAPENLNNDPLVYKLTAAADLAQRDLARLSRAENAIADQKRTPADRQRAATANAVTVPGFERTTQEDIILPYPKAIEHVAQLAGYRFMTSTAISSNPVVVNVTGDGQTLKEVMNQIMDQAPSDMIIHVYAATKTVVLARRS
jgi:hypothetical protein